MATEVIKTIKPSGGDYTSLAAWEAAEQGNLVTADKIAVAECYAMSDTAAVTIDGWTTDATHYIRITVPPSERHNGKWDDTKYRLEPTDANALTINAQFVRVEGLQVQVQSPTASRNEVALGTGINGGEIRCDGLIIRGNNSTNSNGFAPASTLTSGTIYLSNSLIYGCRRSFFGGIRNGGTNSLYVYSCTLVDNYYGVRLTAGNVVVKNTLAKGNTNNFILDSGKAWGTGTDYNASNTTAITAGSNCRINQTFTFVDEANKDYHLASSDIGAKDLGIDLSGDSYPITKDIDGQTRSGLWDIGCDEYVSAAGGPVIPVFMAQYRRRWS